MKKVMNRVFYDTDKAEELASASYGYVGDFRAWNEALFKSSNGRYFVAGEGGPMSRYAVSTGDGTRGGEDIRPLTAEEALDWCEQHGAGVDVMLKIDPGCIQEA